MAVALDSTPAPAVQPRRLLPLRDARGRLMRPEPAAEPLLPAPAPLPSLSTALARRRALFGPVETQPIEPKQIGPIYTPTNPPPCDDWPAVYALRCFGDCCEPEIADGSSLIIDRQAPHTPGDFVAIWSLNDRGTITALVKRLVVGLPLGTRLPYRRNPRSELHPVLFVEKLNPPRQFEVDLSKVYALHRCIGVAPARPDVAIGTMVSFADIRMFGRPSPRLRRAAGDAHG